MNNHTGATPFECKYECGLSFKNRAQRQKHTKTYHEKYHRMDKSAEDKSGEPCVCPVCDDVQTNKALLRLHMRKVHQEKGCLLCSVCGKQFHSKQQLKFHMGSHLEVKPYQCQYCPKTFAHRGSVKLHHKTHTGEKPFRCPHCPRAFAQHPHLKVHLMTHTGEKPEVCPICFRAFALRGNLTVHLRQHTGEKPYVCHVCFRAFYDSSSRKKHVRVTHGDFEVQNIMPRIPTEDNVQVVQTEEGVETVKVEANFQAYR